uniref:Uncharacterized protein n=1 Tax=Oryza punctata TaxID=4537 RepID=A0A0E0JGQ2_ORYPU
MLKDVGKRRYNCGNKPYPYHGLPWTAVARRRGETKQSINRQPMDVAITYQWPFLEGSSMAVVTVTGSQRQSQVCMLRV